MPYTGSGPVIELPPLEPRPWGQFIRVVPSFNPEVDGSDRTAMGVKFQTRNALNVVIEDLDCDVTDETLDAGNITLANREQPAFRIWNLLESSTLCNFKAEGLEALLETDADLLLSEALTRATLTQITTDHLNLADDSTSLTAAAGITLAIAMIEKGLADRISNSQGYIFVPPLLLPAARAAGVVKMGDDGNLYSPAGHLVISDAGHDVQTVLYATAQLEYSLIDPKTTGGPSDGGFDWRTNKLAWLSQAYAVVVFNPAFSVRVTVS